MKYLQAFIIGIFTILIFGAATANAATWTVTKSTNSNDNVCDADCSLREAVFKADSGDTVAFSSNLVGQFITLGGSEIVITKRITIDGYLNNPNVAFISGSNTSRIFFVGTGAGLTLKNIAFVQGNGVGNVSNSGGAIYADSSSVLSLDRVSVRGNSAANFGGAIYSNQANVYIINSSLTSNSSTACSAFSLTESNVKIANVTISGNYDSDVNDSSTLGVACLRDSNTTVRNSTIANNNAPRGGGIVLVENSGNSLNIGNTIVAENESQTGGDIVDVLGGSTIISAGGNLIGDTSTIPAGIFTQPKDIEGVNPLLAPTNSNQGGHPVLTHPLQAGSPARNGGLNANAVDPLTNQPLTTDARGAGFPRIADTTVDIGAFEDQSGNTSLVVTKNANSNDLVCDTDCSLREAVHQASLNFGTDTITFAPNVFGTLALGGSLIEIKNQNVNIVGYPNLSSESLVVSGGNTNQIFYLINATANISGLTLANGNAGGGLGGAILMSDNSNLTLDKVIVRNNFADRAGAIYLGANGTGHITNSTINNNSANTVLAIEVPNGGTLNMANTTVSTNFDANGGPGAGAVFVVGTANIRNSTIAFNRTTGTGGGIFNTGTLNIGNSIVSNNIAAASPDVHKGLGTITSLGGNLVQNTNGFPAGTFSQTNDAVGVDPLLGALADNGGNVTTHLLMPNSPAINTGINVNAVDPFDNSPLLFDARGTGFERISGGTADKGAFESLAATAATVSIAGTVTGGASAISNAKVYLTDQQGLTQTTVTDASGCFAFTDLQAGETYIINVISKKYTFLPQVLTVTDNLDNLNFSGKSTRIRFN